MTVSRRYERPGEERHDGQSSPAGREGLRRLRAGKWRVFFDPDLPGAARIHGIDNRGQAC